MAASASSPPRAGSAQLGYDRRFRRLWELYLAISEAGFREARIMDVQMLFAKPRWTGRVPSRASAPAGARAPGEVRLAVS